MSTQTILNTLSSLTLGDKLAINDWHAKYTVCGISEHFVLAHYGQHYTIIDKRPVECIGYCHNGVRCGDFRCAPDWWVFGYEGGYYFTDKAWVEQYLISLETGDTELSMKHEAPLFFLSVVGHTDKVYRKLDAQIQKKQ